MNVPLEAENMYIHRALERKDLESICTFPQSEQELFYISPRFHFPLTPEQILDLVKDRFEPTVIMDSDKQEAVAYANIYKDEDHGDFWLGNVIVSSDYRGKGASQYLLQVMLEKAKFNLGANQIKLACHSTNSRGLAFYTKLGFKPFDIKISSIGANKFITIHMSLDL
ncbi:GNAT family N-acetyltransferase [Cohnella sp. GbtcB17]|uniref:GNAT family N-acetyltransferase n=1 Tax=Cohnella sp. GbtcB17 TaxID=2824762 RepID=UPI0034D5013F